MGDFGVQSTRGSGGKPFLVPNHLSGKGVGFKNPSTGTTGGSFLETICLLGGKRKSNSCKKVRGSCVVGGRLWGGS